MAEADDIAKESILKEYYENLEVKERLSELMMIGRREIEEENKKQEEHLLEAAKKYEDCIYIEMKQIARGDKLAYNIGGKIGLIEPALHIGNFQDSVLYMKYIEDEEDENEVSLDFRYWPMADKDDIPVFVMTDDGHYVEQPREHKVKEKQKVMTYSWSDNIKRAIIKNSSNILIEFNGQNIAIGETKVFTEDRHVEGLFSPDCYNGKSIFSLRKQK